MDKADADAERLRVQTIRNATEAVREAQQAMATGDLPTAEVWIARAFRLVPADSTVQLWFASITVHSDPDQAVQVLRKLLDRLAWHREAALALAAALLQAGDAAGAADALAAMLRRMALPDLDMVRTIAAGVCDAAGRPGWISLDGTGHCRIGLAPTAKGGTVRLTLDGAAAGSVGVRPGQVVRLALPEHWRRARSLGATIGGRALVGNLACPARFAAVDGFVTMDVDDRITGWARLAADVDTPPTLFFRHGSGPMQPLDLHPGAAAQSDAEDGRPRWLFSVPLATATPVAVVDADGRDLWGSPIWPGAERDAARKAAHRMAHTDPGPVPADPFRPLPASLLPAAGPASPGRRMKRRPACDVIVPVHGGLAELDRCLESLARTLPTTSRLVLVDDGSQEPEIAARLAQASGPRVTVLTHSRSLGFPAAVNAGLAQVRRHGPGRDVLLLNSDTAVDGPWLERLSAVLHSDPSIGSCTPLTNDGTIVSYPEPGRPTLMPDMDELAALNVRCWAVNGLDAVPVPTGVGFCMMLKAACLAETGLLRTDVFAQGYGEENDWSLRAAHLGWRHVAAPGVFVGHSGGRSFGAAKALLLERNAAVLERLHPGYAGYVASALAAEPLLPARRRIDRSRLVQPPGRKATALITHDSGGGVARHVSERCVALAAAGKRPIVLAPSGPGRCSLSLGEERLANLDFTLPREGAELAVVLAEAGVDRVEIHHLLGHDASAAELPARLGVPYDVYVHDYALWCPRITLTSRSQRYCGEPLSMTECEECVADLGSRIGDDVTVRGLRGGSAALLAGAGHVFVACDDAAGRIRRQFPGISPEVAAWEAAETPGASPRRPLRAAGARPEVHVVVAGAIGIEKGYDVLLGCARDAAKRGLPLRFTVVGYTVDDERLTGTGRAFVTGQFAEGDGPALVRRQGAMLGFVPSVWPETWCYALSMLFAADLPVMGFGLGAQGERIGRAGRGWLLPLGIPVTKINDALVRSGLETLQSEQGFPYERRVR